MRYITICCTILALSGCVHFEPNPIPPSVELSPEKLDLAIVETASARVDFGMEIRPNESDSFANIEILPGLKVSDVHPNSPADFAGIYINDVILSVDGVETNDVDTLSAIADKSRPDQKLLFVIRRGTAALEATVIARESHRSVPLRELYRIDPIASRAAYRTEIVQLSDGSDAAVVEVVGMEDNSPLGAVGIQPGDYITAIDSTEVTSAQELVRELIEDYAPGSNVTLTITSNGRRLEKQVRLWNPGRYIARVQLWPLFRYEFRPDPKKVIFQFPEFLPIYRRHATDFETHHQIFLFFNIHTSRTRPDESTYP